MDPAALDLEDVRLAVYSTFARHGRAPGLDDLADCFAASPEQIREALTSLAVARHLALDDAGDIVMAHPFSAVPLGFSVMGTATLWWGGCAWDSFAMAHLLTWEPSLVVATTCPACAAPHAWNLTRSEIPRGGQVAHFLVPASRMWDDVVVTCRNQRIFCDEACVEAWLDRTGHTRGYVMDLSTLWRLATGWYAGRLDRGYIRREPSQAASYLASAGLRGAFWGL